LLKQNNHASNVVHERALDWSSSGRIVAYLGFLDISLSGWVHHLGTKEADASRQQQQQQGLI
jgi:hypothetical protein